MNRWTFLQGMSVARYTPPYTLELAPRCGLSREVPTRRLLTSRRSGGRSRENRTLAERLRAACSTFELWTYQVVQRQGI